MKKLAAYCVVAVFAYLVICMVKAAVDTDVFAEEQRVEARKLANRSLVTHEDGRVTPLSPKDAEMMLETCAMLRTKKLADFTPEMLSVWDSCRSQGIGQH